MSRKWNGQHRTNDAPGERRKMTATPSGADNALLCSTFLIDNWSETMRSLGMRGGFAATTYKFVPTGSLSGTATSALSNHRSQTILSRLHTPLYADELVWDLEVSRYLRAVADRSACYAFFAELQRGHDSIEVGGVIFPTKFIVMPARFLFLNAL